MFFSKHEDNTIVFWDCSNDEWILYKVIDKKTKCFNLILLYPSKKSWDLNKKRECDDLIKEWHTTFKSSDLKGRNFFHLLNNNLLEIEPSYTKKDSWIEYFGFSNLLYAQATRAITNHIPIGEY